MLLTLWTRLPCPWPHTHAEVQRHVNGGHFLSPSSHIDPGTSHASQGTRARRHRSWAVAGCFLLRLLKLVISSGREKPAAVKDLTCRCQGFCSTADQSAWGALDQNPPVHGRPITTSHTTNLTRANDRIRNRRLHLHWVTINSDSCLPFATPLDNTAASAREDPFTYSHPRINSDPHITEPWTRAYAHAAVIEYWFQRYKLQLCPHTATRTTGTGGTDHHPIETADLQHLVADTPQELTTVRGRTRTPAIFHLEMFPEDPNHCLMHHEALPPEAHPAHPLRLAMDEGEASQVGVSPPLCVTRHHSAADQRLP